jgi:hypothetical protein
MPPFGSIAVNAWSTEPPAFVALRVNVNGPAAVGVPVTVPVDVFNERPVGNAPENTEYVGLFVAETESEYALPRTGVAKVLSVQAGALIIH